MNYIYSGLGIRMCHGDYPYTILCILQLIGDIKNFQENKVEEKRGKRDKKKDRLPRRENNVISHL